MKNKKRSATAWLGHASSSAKNYLICFLLLLLAVSFNSCKKELVLPSSAVSNADGSKIKTISYAEFLRTIDLDKTGPLKTSLTNATKTDQGAVMNVNAGSNGFSIGTDSIKKLTLGDTVSYVLALKLETRHAIQFRNLTVQVVKDKTTAFLTTYVPTQEFVKAWKTNKQTPFKGSIYANKISLTDLPQINGLNSTKQGSKGAVMSANPDEILINQNKIGLAPGECEIYDVYTTVPYQCRLGHWPGDMSCTYRGDPTNQPGDDDWPAGYTLERSTVVNCAPPSTSFPPAGGGGGGGGSTTPTTPGGYDPCNCDTPTLVSFVGDNKAKSKLAVVPPNCCDGGGGGSLPPLPSYSFEVQSLKDLLMLDGNRLNYIANNQALAANLYSLLEAENFSYEALMATGMTIAMAEADLFSTSNYGMLFISVNAYLPNTQDISPQAYAAYWIMQCAIIKATHPEYGEWRVGWEASKEMIHLMFDGLGLIPGLGEVADLTNGLIYTIEGDGTNASLSYASAIPFVGWVSSGAKIAKKTLNLANGTKTTLKWTKKVGNVVNFGNKGQLRTIIGLAIGDLRQAHHIIPWGKQAHPAIQKAAKADGPNPFHMNEALNGIPLDKSVHLGSHAPYDANVIRRLNLIPVNATPSQAKAEILDIIADIRTAIQNNTTTHVNNLVF